MEKRKKACLFALSLSFLFPACGQGAEVEERAYLQLNYTQLRLEIGESETLVPTLKRAAKTPVYTFKSADSLIATVDERGRITGVAEGQTSIRVQTAENTASCKVIVVKKNS